MFDLTLDRVQCINAPDDLVRGGVLLLL